MNQSINSSVDHLDFISFESFDCVGPSKRVRSLQIFHNMYAVKVPKGNVGSFAVFTSPQHVGRIGLIKKKKKKKSRKEIKVGRLIHAYQREYQRELALSAYDSKDVHKRYR